MPSRAPVLAIVGFVALVALHADAASSQAPSPTLLRSSELFRAVRSIEDDPQADLLASGLDPAMLGGVPAGDVVPGSLPLSLTDALRRGLDHNLGILLREQQLRRAQGERLEDLAELLPSVFAGVAQRSQEFNFEASPFSQFRPPGAESAAVVDFDTFDARLYLAASLFDRPAHLRSRAARSRVQAAGHSLREMRNLVVLFVGNLYLRSLTAGSRVQAIVAETKTAETLHELAQSRHRSGLVSEIDVLRAQVRLERDRQRLIAARSHSEKTKLRLARAIGLPIGQQLHLIDTIHYTAAPEVTLQEAMARAYVERPDYLALVERVAASRSERRAARAERLPTLDFEADYGGLGTEPDSVRGTFNAAARLRIPLFEGGRIRGESQVMDAELRVLESRLADLEALVYYQVREALLDLEAATERVTVAQRALTVASRQLLQARDRFAAGVTSNFEVVEAQEAVALAREAELAALLAHRLAKGALARALGIDEDRIIAALAAETETATPPGEPR